MKTNIYLKGRSGIYGIVNETNNKLYIGKTKCMYKRCHQHISACKKNDKTRCNEYLLNAYKKYGLERFVFFPIEFVELDDALIAERELFWILKYESTNSKKGYNLRLDSQTKMIVHPETSKKISNRLKKEWREGVRKDHGLKLSKNWKNNHNRKKAQSELMSKTLTKYKYIVEKEGFVQTVLYKELCKMKLQNVQSKFYKNKTSKTIFKGYTIQRVPNS